MLLWLSLSLSLPLEVVTVVTAVTMLGKSVTAQVLVTAL